MKENEGIEMTDFVDAGSYGPGGTLQPMWRWWYKVQIKPMQTIRYRFSFEGWFENAVIIYSMPHLRPLIERGNYSRSTEEFVFMNRESVVVEHVITGWHKPSPPNGLNPWLHSPIHKFQGTPRLDVIGFADDQRRDQQYPKPINQFRNAIVNVEYY